MAYLYIEQTENHYKSVTAKKNAAKRLKFEIFYFDRKFGLWSETDVNFCERYIRQQFKENFRTLFMRKLS